jgi:hypothetical protein
MEPKMGNWGWIVEATVGSAGQMGHRWNHHASENKTVLYLDHQFKLRWSNRCSTKLGPIFYFIFVVGNVPDATGMRRPSKMTHLHSWVHCSAQGCPGASSDAVVNPHQHSGWLSQSGSLAMGTHTDNTVDGWRETMVICFRVLLHFWAMLTVKGAGHASHTQI